LQKLPPNTRVVLTINGKDVEMSAADAAKRIGRGESANQRYEEAARERRQHAEERAAFTEYEKQFISKLSSPAALREEMRALGMSPRQIAEEMIREEERFAQLSPAERKVLEYEAREKQRAQQEESQKQAAFQAEQRQYAQAYTNGFNAMMTAEGIPNGHVMREVLMPSLAAAAAHIYQTEGRDITKREARQLIRHVMEQSASARPMSDEQRRASITQADYDAWQKSQAAQRPQANPPLAPARGPDGKFLPQTSSEPNRGGQRTNVNGERMVSSLSNVYGR
jgi:hypothetical protein